MRPIPSPASHEAITQLERAQRLLEKAEKLEMVEHEGKKVPSFAADGKGAKDEKKKAKDCPECKGKGDDCKCDEKCPTCGEKMDKMGCMKMGCGGKMDVEKSEAGSQPGFETSFDSNPGGVMFMAESGGQTRSAYYTTNQYLYGGEDVTNKGATSESITMDKLSGQLNPHDGGGVDRQVVDGILSKAKDMVEKGVCEHCGANQYTGCLLGIPNCDGLEGTGAPGTARPHDPSDPGRSLY